jgi:cephalosporin-C deacetylase-like acetyl esterase
MTWEVAMADVSMALPKVDARYFTQRSGDIHYSCPRYNTLAEWEVRAQWLREHIQIVLGLWPLPEKAPLNARVTGRIEYDDYVIEKVCFESWPGFYCTGNLYRPRSFRGRVPGILNPHGHWTKGRLEHQPLGSNRVRCITFARMGMIAFGYDMVGYNDSLQVPAHGFATPRGALWGLTSMALQTWNSIRAIDFLQSLSEVDAERIGCTGESGGGTQTFMLTAIEPRIKVAAPVNMVSAHFQGGCTCENTPGLRTQMYNVEIAALTAPRPLFLVSASGDWTVNTPTIEYPAIRTIYQLYGAEDRIGSAQVNAPHNYNAESRTHVYKWFARWFLGDEKLGENAERDFVVEPDERIKVFPTGELPAGSLRNEALEKSLKSGVAQRLQRLFPQDQKSLETFRGVTRTRLEHVLGAIAPRTGEVIAELAESVEYPSWKEQELALGRQSKGDRVTGTLYQPLAGSKKRALVVHSAGRAALRDGLGDPVELVRALLAEGYGVLAIDPFHTKLPNDAIARRDHDWFWSTFNASLLGQRVQDILTALTYLGEQRELALIGLGQAGAWALLAAALSPIQCRVAVDIQAASPDDDDTYLGDLYAPLMRAYGGLRAASALIAPRPLLLMNTAGRFALEWPQAAYKLINASDRLSEQPDPAQSGMLTAWLKTVI